MGRVYYTRVMRAYTIAAYIPATRSAFPGVNYTRPRDPQGGTVPGSVRVFTQVQVLICMSPYGIKIHHSFTYIQPSVRPSITAGSSVVTSNNYRNARAQFCQHNDALFAPRWGPRLNPLRARYVLQHVESNKSDDDDAADVKILK